MEKQNQIQPIVKEEENFSLLEERLVVNRQKCKVGEVVVRKKIETRMIQVPIRREVLIVEKVGNEVEKVAEIDLGEVESNPSDNYYVSSEFVSPQLAKNLLEVITRQPNSGSVKVRIELEVDSLEKEEENDYRKIFEGIARESSV